MLPVYICEDEKNIRIYMEQWIKEYIIMNNYDMKLVMSTEKPEEIVDYIRKDRKRGIYFLDVELSDKQYDGFHLGKEIRKYDSKGFIIYVTSHQELSMQTFQYHIEVLDYIVKGAVGETRKAVIKCLDTVEKRMKQERDVGDQQYFKIQSGDVIKNIPISEIYCFETSGRTHRIVMYAENEIIDFIGRLKEIEDKLGDGFLRVHRSLLININKIKEVDIKQREIMMQNGKKCLFSRQLKSRILQVMGEQYQ